MPEEIKIRINTQYDGSGAQRAINDQEKLKKGGTSSLATEPPNKLTVSERLRESAGDWSHLVTARDGAADTARVASAYHDFKAQAESEVAQTVKELTQVTQQHHGEAMNTVTRKNFSRP